jgi:hypothetical protein
LISSMHREQPGNRRTVFIHGNSSQKTRVPPAPDTFPIQTRPARSKPDRRAPTRASHTSHSQCQRTYWRPRQRLDRPRKFFPDWVRKRHAPSTRSHHVHALSPSCKALATEGAEAGWWR